MTEILYNKIYPEGISIKDVNVGTVKVKFANIGNTLVYDTFKSNSYNNPIITNLNYPNVSYEGGNSIPIKNFIQQWNKIGYSGKIYNQNNITSGGTWNFNIPSTPGVTINSSTGIITWENNLDSENRSVIVTATITINGKTSQQIQSTCIQEALGELKLYFEDINSNFGNIITNSDFTNFESDTTNIQLELGDASDYAVLNVCLKMNTNENNIDIYDCFSDNDQFENMGYYLNNNYFIATFRTPIPINKEKSQIYFEITSFDGRHADASVEISIINVYSEE